MRGFSASAAYYPDTRTTVVVLTNRGDVRTEAIERVIAREVLELAAPDRQEHTLSIADRQSVIGKYDIGVFNVTIVDRGGQLWFEMPRPGPTFPLRHVGNGVFINAADPDSNYVRLIDTDGPGPREQLAQRDAPAFATVDGALSFGEARFEGTDGPERVGLELLQRRAAFVVERADVARLVRAAFVVLFDPAKRKSLRAAHVRTLFVDPAPAFGIEERAGALRMRLAVLEQLLMTSDDPIRLDLEDLCRHDDDAAGRAGQSGLAVAGPEVPARLQGSR